MNPISQNSFPQKIYWLNKLSGELPETNILLDYIRPNSDSGHNQTITFELSNAISQKIIKFTKKSELSIYLFLVAVLNILLYKYIGNSDIIIGSPTYYSETSKELVNNFVPLRFQVKNQLTFKEFLLQVKNTTIGAYSHQNYPLDKLVRLLEILPSQNRCPIFDIVVLLENIHTQAALPQLKNDITFAFTVEHNHLSGQIIYNECLFDKETIKRIVKHYVTIIECVINNLDLQISEIDLLTDDEKYQLLTEFNDNTQVYPVTQTIHQLFEEQVQQTPNKIALVYRDTEVTYHELNETANRLAYLLQKLGVKPGDFVGILHQRHPNFLIGMLAILKVGGAYVPIDSSYPQERIRYMLSNSKVQVLLTESALLDLLNYQTKDYHDLKYLVCLDIADNHQVISTLAGVNIYGKNDFQQLSPFNLALINHRGIEPAYMIYTSGSTGLPKGVIIRHGGAINHIYAQFDALELTEELAFLQSAPASSDISVWQFLAPLLIGGKTVIVDTETILQPSQLFQIVQAQKLTLIELVPVVLKGLLDYISSLSTQQRLLPHLQWMMVTGESVSVELVNYWLSIYPEIGVANAYGPTEAADDITQFIIKKPLPENQRSVPLGKPLANLNLYILDSEMKLLPIGVPGEICVSGFGVGKGYWKNEASTKSSFISNPFLDTAKPLPSTEQDFIYKTGDLGRWLADGTIEFLGRIDHQVKIRGFRIELGEIEALLAQHPAVREIVVIAREDSPGNKRLVAYVVPQIEIVEVQHNLRYFMQEKLPEHMIPSAFVLLEALPLTPNGKVDRRALPAPEQTQQPLPEIFIPPRTFVEEMVVTIWSKVLGIEHIGINDNFFELGGHSLLATMVIARLREAFGIELPLRCLFEAPTVASLSDRIGRIDQKLQAPPIQRVSREQQLPLSFAQQRLWFLDQLQPGNAYNIPLGVRLFGVLNIVALQQSFQEVINRHEALRTVFTTVANQPIQVIIQSVSFTLSVVDLQHLAPTEREAKALQLAKEEARKPFTLDQWPLLRVTLLQLDDTEYLLLLTIHHIVADGWSMGILVQEVATLYEAFCAGKPSPLPQLPLQYVDYAVWQRQWLQGEVLETKLSYWKQQLGHNLPTLQLPTKQNSTSHFQSATHDFQLSPQLSAALNKLSRQESVTLFMTVLAAFQTLLYRYTNQDDMIVGTDLANRTQSEIEQLIGFFVNLLVLRTDMSGNPTFYELLERVREVTLKAYAHQDLPFEKLVAELRPERSLSQTPLFQVLFVMQNAPMPTIEVSGLTLSPWEIENETAFDLAVFVAETEHQIVGSWKYNADLFDAATITKMSNHFETLLASIVKQPDASLNTLEMLTESEKQQQAMEEIKREKSNFSKFKSIKPKAIRLSEELIETEYLQPGQTLPLVIKPVADDIDLVDWVKSSRAPIESKLLQHGAILFRGFNLKSVSEFERIASAICPQLFANYGDLPKEGISDRVYSSTPYPCDRAILFHNESSHLHQWPLKIWFFCLQPAQQGGETPIVDCHKVYQLLDPKLRERFEQKQLMYVRNYIEGLDVSWQNFFHTDDKTVVEKACRQSGMDFEWLPNNGLRTLKVRPAISQHPQTGKSLFFNQVQLHHISCLESDVRASLLSTLGEENLPRNVYYGDGSPIEDSVMAEIEAVYQQAKVSFPWQQGDILMLDNMLTAHGRNPYKGSRKIVVAMGEMISSTNS
ncbi:amino acid adenylation domain-containing protein [Nostoc sp.]|uniref:amino acid adenylation domain-containing protein n=1 Tax=Nostoc sp. TaxID=1180 RepID=UPI002FF9D1A0